jgi:asparagine N-glycosylation enzyme membrane subunit Stt3
MHTLMVLVGGFVLLFFCQLVARAVAGAGVNPMAKAMLVFIPLWFIVTAVNMWVGVEQEGYRFIRELPIFLLVFGVPVAAAVFTWWRLTHLKKGK